MKMLFFDFRESEKEFFNNNSLNDFDIEFIKEPLNELSVLSEEQLEQTDVISVFISSNVTENVIKKFKNLRIITTRSTGYNHIDLKYCTQKNIAVFNVANYGESSVAQFTFMLILSLVRNLIPAYIDIQRSMVNHPSYEGRDINKLSIGILGCGSIGASVAKIADFFGMQVYVCSYEKNKEISNFAQYVSVDEMLAKSDIISLHLPYSAETHHIINEESFSKMKDGVYIINTARGELLDIVALYNNLLSGHVKGAALDVVECENVAVSNNPLCEDSSNCVAKALIIQKLLSRPDVIITPHIAYNTKESVETILKTTFNSIRDFSKGLHTNQLRG